MSLRPGSPALAASWSIPAGREREALWSHPHRSPDTLASDEIHPLMDLAVEMRQRVTDQLAKILPTEFSNVQYGFKLTR